MFPKVRGLRALFLFAIITYVIMQYKLYILKGEKAMKNFKEKFDKFVFFHKAGVIGLGLAAVTGFVCAAIDEERIKLWRSLVTIGERTGL